MLNDVQMKTVSAAGQVRLNALDVAARMVVQKDIYLTRTLRHIHCHPSREQLLVGMPLLFFIFDAFLFLVHRNIAVGCLVLTFGCFDSLCIVLAPIIILASIITNVSCPRHTEA